MKRMIHHIVFATDFSECSMPAFQTALTWANTYEATLDIVHVMGIMQEIELGSAVATLYLKEQQEQAKVTLKELENKAKETLPTVRTHMLEGFPAHEIAAFAETSQADLVITGTHGWTGIDHVMMGSVAERTIYKAPCPVLCVRDLETQKTASTDDLHVRMGTVAPRHILLPIDFSDCSLDAYEYVVNLERSHHISVTLLHVIEPLSYSLDFTLSHPSEDRQHREEVKTRLANLTNAFTKQGLTANYLIKSKPTSEAILEALSESGADLIVMGTHGRQGLRRLMMGNVAAAVLRQSPVPVLTVKSPKFKRDSVCEKQVNIQEVNS